MTTTDATVQYSSRIDEMIRRCLLSTVGVNNNVEYGKGRVVKIYSNPYDELDHSFSMSHQKSFTFATGRGDTNKSLQRQIEQIVVPAIDTCRFSIFTDNSATKVYKKLTIENAYNTFKTTNTLMTNKKIEEKGRVAFCVNNFIELLMQDCNFVKAINLPDDRFIYKGMVGECDNIPIIAVPKRRLPKDVAFIITHPIYISAPIKLQEYKIYRNPPGIEGILVEGLIYYDVFITDKNKDAIATCYNIE